ncbi:MAG: hypothetical protein IJJ77_07320 [Paludibacteraceae bacterium]|nr:hypothetical protein [Paludibacteraceae bacterium]
MKKITLLGLALSLLTFGTTGCHKGDIDDEKNNGEKTTIVDGVSNSGTIGKYAYVNLGLSVKWATYNVGAPRPTGYGKHFAWGETVGKDEYLKSNYRWYDQTNYVYTKYCTNESYGTVDDMKVLDAEDDAATANWGSSWRMPTDEEMEELINGCTWEFVSDFNGSGTGGALGKSKQNGNTIFLPMAGFLDEDGFTAEAGLYWSSSLYNKDNGRALNLGVVLLNKSIKTYADQREMGASIRAVSE